MSQNSNISYLNFLKKAGISSFLQNNPNNFYEINNKEKKDLVFNNISEVRDLEKLEFFIKKLNNFKKEKQFNKFTIGEGNRRAKILIIGDSHQKEKENIRPFTGDSEKLLIKMLKAINLDIKDTYLTNAIPLLIQKNYEIKNEDILDCLPILQKVIEIINPKIILLMGSIANKAILNSSLEISKLRGKCYKYSTINLKKNIDCLSTYHPKHLINFPQEKKFAWEDLQILQKLYEKY